MPPTDRPAAGWRRFQPNARWYLVCTFLSGLGFGVFGLFYNLYVLSLGFDRPTLGLLLAVPLLVVCISALPAGSLARRIGYRNTLAIGLVAYVGAIVGLSSLPTRAGLLGFALGLGIGQTLFDVCNAPLVAENSVAADRTQLFSTQYAVRLFASFFGSLAAGAMPATFARWLGVGAEAPAAYRVTLLLSALLLCVAFLPLLRIKGHSRTAATSDPVPPARRTQWATLWRLFIPQIVIGIGAGALVPFLNVFLKSRFALSDGVLGVLFAAQAIAMGAATLFGPALAARIGRIRALVLTQVASIPFLAILGFSPLFPVAACAFLARAGLMNMGSPLYSAFSMEQVDVQHRATASALLVMSAQGSRALSSWISGILQERAGFTPVFLLTIACYMIASSLVLRFFGRRPLAPPVDS